MKFGVVHVLAKELQSIRYSVTLRTHSRPTSVAVVVNALTRWFAAEYPHHKQMSKQMTTACISSNVKAERSGGCGH